MKPDRRHRSTECGTSPSCPFTCVCSTNHISNPTCSNDLCDGACDAGWADCNDDKATDGCEADLVNNSATCGACGSVCSTNHVSNPNCANGVCNGTCDAGWADCNGSKLTDGCEVDVLSSPSSCGSCGVTCSINHIGIPTCSNGTCSGTCDGGWADCNGNKLTDGCEIDVLGSPVNCSGCGNACSTNHISSPTCASGTCSGSCDAGWADCNGNKLSDGCESDVLGSPANCGDCGSVCSTNHISSPSCANGTCNGTCVAGWADCNGNKLTDGCETDLGTIGGSCGTCDATAVARSFSNATALAIPDSPAPPVTSTITVSGIGPYLYDLNLITFLEHASSQQLEMTLMSPAGTVVTITTRNGSVNVFNGTFWDDQADPGSQIPYSVNPNIVTDHTYATGVLATPLTPEEPLGAFIGENPNGVWMLTIRDIASGATGTLNSWSVEATSLSTIPTESTVTSTNTTPLSIPQSVSVTSTVTISGAGSKAGKISLDTFVAGNTSGNVVFTLQSPLGTIVSIHTQAVSGAKASNVFNGTTWRDNADPDSQIPYAGNPQIGTDHSYSGVVVTPLTSGESLAAFDGENPNGTWILSITHGSGPSPILNQWSLHVTTFECP